VSAYKLAELSNGRLSRTGIYRLTADDLKAIRFESLGVLIPALRELTGEQVEVSDLLEYVPNPEPTIDEESRLWLEAELTPPLEPYDWGDVDPLTLPGGRAEYVEGEGLYIYDSEDAGT
jgi:DNA-binding Xre family transcriptional regulator